MVNRITSRCNQPPSVLRVGPRAVLCFMCSFHFCLGIHGIACAITTVQSMAHLVHRSGPIRISLSMFLTNTYKNSLSPVYNTHHFHPLWVRFPTNVGNDNIVFTPELFKKSPLGRHSRLTF